MRGDLSAHVGGSQSYYTVRALRELKSLIPSFDNYLEIVITIWKNHTQAEFESEEPGTLFLDSYWIYAHGSEVVYFSVQKNRNWTESYVSNPERYDKYVREWAE
jgi:hypothetical protein